MRRRGAARRNMDVPTGNVFSRKSPPSAGCEYLFRASVVNIEKCVIINVPQDNKTEDNRVNMVKIRLQRCGNRGRPFYRIIAAHSEAKRDGRFLEIIGTYNPLPDPSQVSLKEDRVRYWLGVGAQPTRTVERLLRKHGIGKEAQTQ